MPTNPFTSSSNRRQQILVPKELFPRKNSSNLINGVDLSSSSSYRRPVKLPLRKHHSFHFQSSQTVAGSGALKHEQFQPSKQSSSTTNQQRSTKERYRNQGPLVFKPFSEKSAFKPIVPSPPKGGACAYDSATVGEPPINAYDASTMPRICGTSLKRHISNVETFSTAINQWNQSDDNDEDNVTLENLQPTTMGDKNRRRKIHYADLAPLPMPSAAAAAVAAASNVNAIYQRNDRNNNSSSNENSDNIDSSSSSGGGAGTSERHASSNNDMPNKATTATIAPSAGQATTTQYATLRFDEVSI